MVKALTFEQGAWLTFSCSNYCHGMYISWFGGHHSWNYCYSTTNAGKAAHLCDVYLSIHNCVRLLFRAANANQSNIGCTYVTG